MGCEGERGLLLEFWDPIYISGVVEARNSRYSTHIDHKGTIGIAIFVSGSGYGGCCCFACELKFVFIIVESAVARHCFG